MCLSYLISDPNLTIFFEQTALYLPLETLLYLSRPPLPPTSILLQPTVIEGLFSQLKPLFSRLRCIDLRDVYLEAIVKMKNTNSLRHREVQQWATEGCLQEEDWCMSLSCFLKHCCKTIIMAARGIEAQRGNHSISPFPSLNLSSTLIFDFFCY